MFGRFVSVATSLSVLAVAASASARDLIYADFMPPKHAINAVSVGPMIEKLKGTMSWRLSTSGELLSGRTALQSIGGRVADAGFVLSAYHQKALKTDFTLNDLMYSGQDPLAVNGAALETHFFDCPGCRADYKTANTILLAGYATFDFGMMCNDRITSLADLKGKKLRTTGAYGRWAQAVGGVPVSMTSDDMVQAIERGQIDCIVGPIAWVRRYPVADALKTVVDYSFGVFPQIGLFVMNLDAWNESSMDQKKMLLAEMPGAIARIMIDGYMADGEKARQTLRENGVELYKGSKEFDTLLAEFRTKDYQTVIDRAKDRGVANPERIIEAYRANLEKWQKLMDGRDRTAEAYEKVLQEQIYSRLDPAGL